MSTIYERVRARAPSLMNRLKNPQQIEIQERQSTPDGMGGNTTTWATVATVDAVVIPMSARECLEADRSESSVTHKIYMTIVKDELFSFFANFANQSYGFSFDASSVTATHRLKFGARIFNPTAPQDIAEAGAWIRVDAEEGVAT